MDLATTALRPDEDSLMDTTHLVTRLRSISAVVSRRGLVAALVGGLLATGSLALGLDEAGATKNHHRKRKKRRNWQPPSPSLPPPVITADAVCSEISDGSAGGDGNARLAQTFVAL